MGLLILTGFLPLAMGWLINWHMMLHPDTFPPLFIIGIAVLFVWTWIARNVNKKMLNTGLVMLCQNLAGLLAIFMLAVQAVSGGIWNNLAGILPQMFFIPVMYIGVAFLRGAGPFLIYLVTFALMVLASFLGCKWAEK